MSDSKKYTYSILWFLFAINIVAHAGVEDLYSDALVSPSGEEYKGNLNLVPLRYTNVASCAKDSKSPTRSAFVIVDSYNIGKLVHSLSKNADLNSLKSEKAAEAMSKARLRLARLSREIMAKLIDGQLPLIGPDLLKKDKVYKKALDTCGEDFFCKENYDWLEAQWLKSKKPAYVDDMKYGCYYLKHFSPLQDHLFTDVNQLDNQTLNAIGETASLAKHYLTQCNDPNMSLKSRRFIMQLDVLEFKNKKWKKIGFSFWRSFRAYLSWSWRQDLYLKRNMRFLKSVDIEDSILMSANGCKSIEKPECSVEQVSRGSLRALGMTRKEKDYSNILSVSPENMLLRKKHPSVNRDNLSIFNSKTYNPNTKDWLHSFTYNLSNFKAVITGRLWRGVNTLTLISETITPKELIAGISKFSKQASFTNNDKNNLYYMCTEYLSANHKLFGHLKSRLGNLAMLEDLPNVNPIVKTKKMKNFVNYFNKVDDQVSKICTDLQHRKIWDEDFKLSDSGFKEWFHELTSSEEKEVKNSISADEDKLIPASDRGTKYLDELFCDSPVDCARSYLESLLNISSYTNYMKAFDTLKKPVRSAALFNPYKERVACGLYDPWGKTKRTIQGLAIDAASAAIFSYNNLPVFVGAHIVPGRVTSFDRLINEEGKLELNAQKKRASLRANIIANLGPITGTPCMVSIGNRNFNPRTNYIFNGITFNVGIGTQSQKFTSHDAETLEKDEDKLRALGLSCSLNFTPISGLENYDYNNEGRSNVLGHIQLLRTVVRFFRNITHKVHVPRSKSVDLNKIRSVYERNGEKIPKECDKKIKNGKSCYRNVCEKSVEKFFKRNFSANLQSFYKEGRVITVRSTACRGKFTFLSGIFSCMPKRLKILDASPSCNQLFNNKAEELMSSK